jgi:uncharacterized protein (TIGR00725 family)
MSPRETRVPPDPAVPIAVPVAVIGAGECDSSTYDLARAVGRLLAEAGHPVVTGGLGGVMEAASRGAAEAGGETIGMLPGDDPADANAWVRVPLPTGLGEARNALVVRAAAACVALPGSWGTLSEIALARRAGKPVISLGSWDVDPSIVQVDTPEQALARLREELAR